MFNHTTGIRRDQPALYQIKLQGRLGQEWATTFDNLDLQIEYTEDGFPVTILSGGVLDQAALHGLLQQIRDLGVVLLLVKYLHPLVANASGGEKS
jgi:hypothetical protein